MAAASGNNERKESTIKEDRKGRTTEEQVSREDINGKLTPAPDLSRNRRPQPAKENVAETYSTDVTGSAPEGNLRLDRRVTVVKRAGSDGAQELKDASNCAIWSSRTRAYKSPAKLSTP
jgi:hypothetical protein